MDLICKYKRKFINVYNMFKYGYMQDYTIQPRTIHYSINKRQYYNVYKGNNNTKHTIFFIHGGGWCQGSPSLYSAVGKFFSKKGYTTVIVGYRLVPKYTYPEQIKDAFNALKHYISTHHNKDEKIIVGGYSAGAEIASHLVFDRFRQQEFNIDTNLLDGFISLSGVLNFSECNSSYSKKLIKNYIGKQNINDINPIGLINKNSTMPTLCIHGDKDTLIDVNNSISFIKRLKLVNKNTNLILIPNEEHEYTIDIVRGPGNNYSKYIFKFIESV